jgi:protein SCO1/2
MPLFSDSAAPPRRLLLQHAAAVLAAGLTAPAGAASAGSAPGFFDNFRGMRLLDHDGQPLQTAQFGGHLVLVHFVYTGCSTTCPLQVRALADLQQQLPPPLRARVRLLSVSLDPLHDTPAVLKAFATRMGADLSGWRFATGRPQDVARVADALRLFRPGVAKPQLDDHSTALWLVDGSGQLRMRYAGNPPDVPRLLRELAALAPAARAAQS